MRDNFVVASFARQNMRNVSAAHNTSVDWIGSLWASLSPNRVNRWLKVIDDERIRAVLKYPSLQMNDTDSQLLSTTLTWTRAEDTDFPYVCEHQGRVFRLRLGDFPAEPLYTAMEGQRALFDIEDWPGCWVRPEE